MHWNGWSTQAADAAVASSGAPKWVQPHCRAVACLAVAMAKAAKQAGHDVDIPLIAVGALWHDIGRAQVQDVRHAHIGADMLRQQGAPEPLVRIVERHTGGGIPPDEAERLGLPVRNYLPVTLEEKIVAHADNLRAGDRAVDIEWLRQKYQARDLHPAWRRIQALDHELAALLGQPPGAIAAAPWEAVAGAEST